MIAVVTDALAEQAGKEREQTEGENQEKPPGDIADKTAIHYRSHTLSRSHTYDRSHIMISFMHNINRYDSRQPTGAALTEDQKKKAQDNVEKQEKSLQTADEGGEHISPPFSRSGVVATSFQGKWTCYACTLLMSIANID